MTVVLNLPMPPSVNGLWLNRPGKGRIKSPAYRKWLTQAGWELLMQRPKPIAGRVAVEIVLAERAGSDVDNRVKATVDLLVTHRVIEGDSNKHVRKVSVEWGNLREECRVTVRPA